MDRFNFFSILPENFFNVFNGSYKIPAAECLSMLYRESSQGLSFSMDRERAVFLIKEYFENTQQEIEDEQNNHLSASESASYLLRRFRDCGWIEEELGENYQYFIHLQDYAVEIIKTLSTLNRNYSVEYSGYISLICDALKNFKVEKGAITLEQIYHNTEELFRKLSSLNTNIKRYIQRLLDEKLKNDLTAIMNQLLDEFQTKIVDRAYYNLATKDHPEKYKGVILNKLDALYDDYDVLNMIARQYMELKDIDFTEAMNIIMTQLNFVMERFESIGEIMEEIDKKHAKYVSSAVSRILYLLDVHEDVEGKLNRLITAVNDDVVNSEDLFDLSSVNFVSDNSLFTARTANYKIENQSVEYIELDDSIIQYYQEKYKNDQRFSKKAICKYVDNLIGESQKKQASDLLIESADDFTYLILMYMYGYSKNVDFVIEELDEVIINKGYRFRNFEVRRKRSYE